MPGTPGERSDLKKLKADIDAGMLLPDIADNHFGQFIRYRNGINAYKLLRTEPRQWQTEVQVLWGPPGTGKSRRINHLCERHGFEDCYWLSKPNSSSGALWWDGYYGQSIVVIDEFYGWIQRDFMLRLIDRYPLQIQVKGSSAQMVPKKIYITSNDHPVDWYPKVGLGGLKRRLAMPIGEVIYVTHPEFPTMKSYLESKNKLQIDDYFGIELDYEDLELHGNGELDLEESS